ncbi:MAG: STAS/SEC14 domain-containing protein [Candidatus Dadabacteria bacterium]|nr:STAS/SEC14 domain-containing protein [Candidatus Dadabacteria bacterium]
MIEIIPFEEGNIIGFRLKGKLEDSEFDDIVRILEERLKLHKKLRVYAEVEEFKGMSVNSFMKDIHYGLKHWRDFDKEAVVSDKGWLRVWAEIAGSIIPGVEVKHFSFDEKEEAKEWIRE